MRIHLEDGFRHDKVEVHVDGRVVLSEKDVSTDYSIGLAKAIEVDAPEGRIEVEIRIASRGDLHRRVEVDTRHDSFLAIRLPPDGGRIETSTAAAPPEYF